MGLSMSFRTYLSARPVAADVEAEFAAFAADNRLPEPTTWVGLAGWLARRDAPERVISGARKVWAEYTAIRRGAARGRSK